MGEPKGTLYECCRFQQSQRYLVWNGFDDFIIVHVQFTPLKTHFAARP